ncbi:MAG: rhomboid family intramembrane serine protease [Hyphomicrobiaceae bacterium]
MFVPLSDDNPLRSIPFQYVTILLIAANVAVFFFAQSVAGVQATGLALVPVELRTEGIFGPVVPGETFDGFNLPERITLITYMFMHADILHLAGNMLFLWVFGDNIEDAMGHARFLVFYLLCGVAAAMAHVIMTPDAPASGFPLVGASGAVAGCVGAYLVLHPKVRIWILVLRFIPFQVSAAWALGAWAVMQVMALVPQSTPVAWWAHVGGLVAGAILIVIMRRPGVPLFDRTSYST